MAVLHSKIIRAIILTFGFLIATELVLHALVRPSARSYGRLFGRELPPVELELVSPRDFRYVNEKGTFAAFGTGQMLIPDRDAGYAPREHYRSADGLIATNNLGARASSDVRAQNPPSGRVRVVFFGDSTTFGYGLAESDSFLSRLQARRPEWEIVNMGVGSYGLGQSFSLSNKLAARTEGSVFVYVLIPAYNNWRERNVLRSLISARSFALLPAWRETGGDLRLSYPPKSYFEGDAPANGVFEYFDRLPPDVQDYIQANDAFFFRPYYSGSSLLSHSMLYKITATILQNVKMKKLLSAQQNYDPAGPFLPGMVRLTRRILESGSPKRKAILVVLPGIDELGRIRQNPGYRRMWENAVAAFRWKDYPVLDGTEALLKSQSIDYAYDMHHPGSGASEAIAEYHSEALAPQLPKAVGHALRTENGK